MHPWLQRQMRLLSNLQGQASSLSIAIYVMGLSWQISSSMSKRLLCQDFGISPIAQTRHVMPDQKQQMFKLHGQSLRGWNYGGQSSHEYGFFFVLLSSKVYKNDI